MRQSTIFSRLRGLLEVTRLVRTGEELPELLAAIARTVSDSLAFRTVVINLYRREWDDFIVTTVYGSDDARAALLGQVQPPSDWEPLLDARFLQRGAYFVPAGEFDWDAVGGTTYTPDLAVSDDPTAWHPDDALFTPMRGADGELLGILSVDEPISGRRPSGDEIDVLVAVSEHAALAVQAAQEGARAQANRDALERLLAVSTTPERDVGHVEPAQTGLRRDLGGAPLREGRRAAARRTTGSTAPSPQVGFADGENMGVPLSADELERLLTPEFDVAGCYLIPHAAARAALPDRPAGLQLAARRPRSVRLAERLAVRAAARTPRRPHRLHLGRRPDRPAAAGRRAPEDPARVREPGDDRARAGSAVRGDPERVRAPPRADRRVADGDRRLRPGRPHPRRGTAAQPRSSAGPPTRRSAASARSSPRTSLPAFLDDARAHRGRRDGSRPRRAPSASRRLADRRQSSRPAPIREANGKVVGVIATMIDVTQRKRSERRSRASEARKDASSAPRSTPS